MNLDLFVLCLLLVVTNAFWAFITHKLLNKVMSRTFWEYQQAKIIPKTEAEALKDALSNVKVKDSGPNELDALDEMIAKVMPM